MQVQVRAYLHTRIAGVLEAQPPCRRRSEWITDQPSAISEGFHVIPRSKPRDEAARRLREVQRRRLPTGRVDDDRSRWLVTSRTAEWSNLKNCSEEEGKAEKVSRKRTS